MGNPDKGEVALTVGDVTYTLTLKTAGLSALQKRLSPPGQIKSIVDVLIEVESAIQKQSVEHVVVFLWAALRKHHASITEQQTVELIDDLGGLAGLGVKLAELQSVTQPDPADVEELTKDANPPKAQTTKKRGAGAASSSAHA
jgi:hypothetical protein